MQRQRNARQAKLSKEGELPPSRRERDLKRHREEITSAAEQVFAEYGYHKGSIQEIARRAEFGMAKIYTMFGSKQELFLSVVETRGRELYQAMLDAVGKQEDPLDKIDKIVEVQFIFFNKNRHFLKLYLDVTKGFLWRIRSEFDERIQVLYREVTDFLEKIVREGVRKKRMEPMDPKLLTVIIVGLLQAIVMQIVTEEAPQNAERHLTEVQRIIRKMILVSPVAHDRKSTRKG